MKSATRPLSGDISVETRRSIRSLMGDKFGSIPEEFANLLTIPLRSINISVRNKPAAGKPGCYERKLS